MTAKDALGTGGGAISFRAFGLSCALALAACDGTPSGPASDTREYLAGGGRVANGDAFVGGPGHSGPATPGGDSGRPDIWFGYFPIFYSELNCFDTPFTRVIASQAEWTEWLEVATSCGVAVTQVWDGGHVGVLPPPADSTLPGDSAVTEGPTDPTDPTPWEPPLVDFDSSAVIAIGIESAAGWGRSVQVTDVTTVGELTTVRFDVLTPGDDCVSLVMAPFEIDLVTTSPTLAVAAPRPFGANVAFERSEVVWHCVVEPDPLMPLALYYTDASCDLGGAEAIIRDQTAWARWLETAAACDFDRWGGGVEPGNPGLFGPDASEPGTPTEPPRGWLVPSLDFSTHAVVILRSEPQTRWGGGVWLNAIDTHARGTTLEYSVMTPGGDCPIVEGGSVLRPTAAIRVPLPLLEPIVFRRNAETIDCRWETVDTGVATGGGSGPSTGLPG